MRGWRRGCWDGWMFGAPTEPAYHTAYPKVLLQDMVAKPFAQVQTFDFNKDPARLRAALASDLDARPDMRRFFDRGGKLIIWHGWADVAIPPQATLNFHAALLKTSGPHAKDSVRLFMLPGVQHCFGGPGPDMIGQMTAPPIGETPERNVASAVQAWVETGRAPQSLIGRRTTDMGAPYGAPMSGPEKQRLICAYPATAVLQRPNADPDVASSYTCRAPRGRSDG